MFKAVGIGAMKAKTNHAKILSRKEGRKLLDRQAKHYLGMSGQEFVRKWNEKKFKNPDRPEILQLAFLIPFGR